MKVMNRILIYMSALLMPFLMASCVSGLTEELGEPDNADCYGVYFPSQAGTGDHQVGPDDAKSMKFSLRRLNTRGSVVVPVIIESSEAGVFTASEVCFEEDSPTAEIEVFFPTIKLGVKYDCTLKVEGSEFVSSYSQNATHLSFSVTCVKWKKVIGDAGETTGLWRDGIFPEWFSVARPNLEQAVEIYEREDLPGYYRIYDVYGATYMTNMFGMDASSVCLEKHYTYIDATDPEKVWIPTFKTGIVMSADYGEISIASYVTENKEFDASISSIYGTLKDGVITFPSNALHMHLAVLGWYPSNSYSLHRIILPGYRALETNISVNAGVTGANGKLPVRVDFGVDIKTVKLHTVEGDIPESEIAALAESIAAGTEKANLDDMRNSGEVLLSFDKTGDYTVIAVGLDLNGKLANYAFDKFGYKTDNSEKPVELNFGLIRSNKYLPDGMTEENSLELYVNGKDIKRLHLGLYEKEKYDKDPQLYQDALGDMQLNEASLAQVNGEGLSLVQSGLAPGTEYILILRAYNGYSEEDYFCCETTGGEWDYRLAFYDEGDTDLDKMMNVIDRTNWYGTYNYYAMEGSSSRYCLGEVVIEDSETVYSGQKCVKVSGLFPHLRKTYKVTDDSMDFYYYGGYIWNYDLRLDYFIFEGMYVYTSALLYATNGSAYGGQGGLYGVFVQKSGKDGAKPCIALLDTGMAANAGIDATFSGFALLGYEDSDHTVSIGLLDLVESIVLVPKDQDPDPLYPEKEVEEEEMETAGLKMLYNMSNQKHYMNLVETSEGFMMSLIDRNREKKVVHNYFDIDSAYML